MPRSRATASWHKKQVPEYSNDHNVCFHPPQFCVHSCVSPTPLCYLLFHCAVACMTCHSCSMLRRVHDLAAVQGRQHNTSSPSSTHLDRCWAAWHTLLWRAGQESVQCCAQARPCHMSVATIQDYWGEQGTYISPMSALLTKPHAFRTSVSSVVLAWYKAFRMLPPAS